MPSQRLNNVLTIDPGWKTGLALWKKGQPETILLLSDGVTRTEKLESLQKQFKSFMSKWPPKKVIMESVVFWANSARSQTSFSKDDAIYLAYLCGIYISECISLGIEFELVPVYKWKGQLQDSMVIERVEEKLNLNLQRFYGQHKIHVYDALGIGLWKMGKF